MKKDIVITDLPAQVAEKKIRNALIELGWTPPPESKTPIDMSCLVGTDVILYDNINGEYKLLTAEDEPDANKPGFFVFTDKWVVNDGTNPWPEGVIVEIRYGNNTTETWYPRNARHISPQVVATRFVRFEEGYCYPGEE